jgi:hypothetical protein
MWKTCYGHRLAHIAARSFVAIRRAVLPLVKEG